MVNVVYMRRSGRLEVGRLGPKFGSSLCAVLYSSHELGNSRNGTAMMTAPVLHKVIINICSSRLSQIVNVIRKWTCNLPEMKF